MKSTETKRRFNREKQARELLVENGFVFHVYSARNLSLIPWQKQRSHLSGRIFAEVRETFRRIMFQIESSSENERADEHIGLEEVRNSETRRGTAAQRHREDRVLYPCER